MLGGHYGNWEVAAASFGTFGVPVSLVARDFDNPLVHRWFADRRRASGGRLISKKGGGEEVTEVLEAGGVVGLLGDQDAGSAASSCRSSARTPARSNRSPCWPSNSTRSICVGYARRLPDDFQRNRWTRFEIGSETVLDPRDFDNESALRDITVAYTEALERLVRMSPEQYFWVHRRWKSVPKPRGRKARERAAALAAAETVPPRAAAA